MSAHFLIDASKLLGDYANWLSQAERFAEAATTSEDRLRAQGAADCLRAMRDKLAKQLADLVEESAKKASGGAPPS